MMTKTLMTTLSSAALALAAGACGGTQTQTQSEPAPTRTAQMPEAPSELERAAQTRWDVSLAEDNGLMVRKRDGTMPAPRERATWPEDGDNILIAVQEAADSVMMQAGKEAMSDIRVKIDRPGLVVMDGRVQTEEEAVRVIDAALGVAGVEAVVSYLEWPGYQEDVAELQLER